MVGEASLALATACYGRTAVNGNSGHDPNDVLYIAFKGDSAVPGKDAAWHARSYDEFEKSISTLGDKLIERISSPAAKDNGAQVGTNARLQLLGNSDVLLDVPDFKLTNPFYEQDYNC